MMIIIIIISPLRAEPPTAVQLGLSGFATPTRHTFEKLEVVCSI